MSGATAAHGVPEPLAPSTPHLWDVLPAVVSALGVAAPTQPLLTLAPTRRAVVVLVDGLGEQLLRRRAGHAPFLRTGLDTAYGLVCGYPSTTATSMGSFGTGLPPGAHGLVGYEMLVPTEDRIFNALSWQDGPDARRWQPEPTVFELAERAGVAVTRIGPGFFDGSGLTTAALRGGNFVAAQDLSARVEAALAAVRQSRRALVYLYWGDVDKAGHVHGVDSWEWTAELERVDAALAELVARVPRDTTVLVTADHGMVDVPFDRRIDLADETGLLTGVRHVGGEPRAVQLYTQPGASGDVAAAWQSRLGEDARVVCRVDLVAEGAFGPVSDTVLPRIGDVLVNAVSDIAVIDSSRMRPELLRLVGLHGSVTPAEASIPLLVWPARIA